MESGEEPEPSELFGDLGTLVVEGRMPGGQRGFHEGPHCVLVYPYRQNKHACDPRSTVCHREAELRRYMYLLWRNNIPMSVEVLLGPPCAHGQKRAAAVDATPEPGYLLLEQWTVHMETAMRCHRSSVGARALLQAVYSYLHFSQLSAWLSRSGGALPRNIMYRITVPGDAFGTRFVGGAPQLHTFPTAYLARDRTMVQVSVRALPRSEAVPSIPCSTCDLCEEEEPQGACAAAAAAAAPPPAQEAAASLWSDEDLRRSIVKSRLHGALSDSRDSLLGDSLLDPPRSLHKYPKRYQSPSRSGSPSLETPEHLMFGSRDSSAERRDERSRGLSRRVITDQCADPDLAWTQGRATWRLEPEEERSVSPAAETARRPGSRSPPRWRRTEETRRERERRQREEEEQRDREQEERREREERQRQLEMRLCPTEEPRKPWQEAWEQSEASRPGGDASTEESQWKDGQEGSDWPRPRTPQRSRSDSANLFRLTPAERRQVEAVLRHTTGPPPRPPENPLLSAIERAGLGEPHAARLRTSQQTERASPVCGGDPPAAPPLLPSIGDRVNQLPGLVRRALSFEQPPPRGASVDGEATVDPRRGFTAVDRTSETSPEDSSGRDADVEYSGGDGVFERTAKGACEMTADGLSGNVCHVSSERLLNGASEKVTNGHAASTNGTSERTVDRGQGDADLVPNGTGDSREKGFRAAQSANLLKRLFKRDAQQEPKEAELKEPPAAVGPGRAQFRRSLDSATSAAFSQRTGLPLSSSPAPVRRGTAFHFDAALTKVKTFSSALNELSDSGEAGEDAASPTSPRPLSSSCPAGVVSSLLGSFEESVLNGRLGPVSTVEGFTAEIGASGSFHPKHIRLPVTVFFYSLSDNEKISSPYMGHVNLGRKGYHVPKKGTLQVTLFNPHGTVVKMFVVLYDLSAMPPGCQTFLRQRTLYMPVGESPEHPNSQKWLRYLIHLRFATGRTGRVYVHTDMRMIIFRKSDMDAAALHTSSGIAHEMRSFVHMPDNPRFSPRK